MRPLSLPAGESANGGDVHEQRRIDDTGPGGQKTPLGRAGQPTEPAPAYVFLASPGSGYVLGETLNVNGGMPTP